MLNAAAGSDSGSLGEHRGEYGKIYLSMWKTKEYKRAQNFQTVLFLYSSTDRLQKFQSIDFRVHPQTSFISNRAALHSPHRPRRSHYERLPPPSQFHSSKTVPVTVAPT